jgi:hypothetical protein
VAWFSSLGGKNLEFRSRLDYRAVSLAAQEVNLALAARPIRGKSTKEVCTGEKQKSKVAHKMWFRQAP